MLGEEIRNKINIIDKIESWENAIKLAAKPLILDNSITENYVRAMINNVKKFGAYIVINDAIALAHSRPEDGVIKDCLSLLKINDGVSFDENLNEKVYLIFVLGAVTNKSHIDVLSKLMEIIDNQDMIDRMIEATSINSLIEILEEVL
ncbi:PTS sugar transporter subunit IIA [Fusobacterium sp.]|uniref:PTS sugar transporter subunit IIA n=1 Tax=Fusobacterium sp. TaxID=68766 RepID=UPI00262922EA|nr:PTS sugar transporter subunit IIA [Fusobacterium sp.]